MRVATSCGSHSKIGADDTGNFAELHNKRTQQRALVSTTRYCAGNGPSVHVTYAALSTCPVAYRHSVRVSKCTLVMMNCLSRKPCTTRCALALRPRPHVARAPPTAASGPHVPVHTSWTPSSSTLSCKAAQTIDSIDRSEYISGYSKSTLLGRVAEALLRRAPYVRFFVWYASQTYTNVPKVVRMELVCVYCAWSALPF